MDRRRFLSAAVVSAALLPLPAARALRLEEDDASTPRAAAYFARCEAPSAHERLVAELLASLEGRESREEAIAEIRAMSCPLCGCSLALAIPDPPAPRF